jgi:hypothetical protein
MKHALQVANFVFKIGEKELLDVFEEWFFDVIKEGRLPGRGETKEFIFSKVSLHRIGELNEPVIIGQLIKDIRIKAEQQYDQDNDQLKLSDDFVDLSPSAFFILTLKDHKLLWVKEIARAPEIKNFQSCIEILVRRKRNEFLRVISEQLGDEVLGKEKTDLSNQNQSRYHEALRQEYAKTKPEIHVTPLTDRHSLEKSLEKFEKIKSLQINFKTVNSELGNDGYEFLFGPVRQEKHKLGSDTPKLFYSNNVDGLNKKEASRLMKAAGDGNYYAKAKGITEEGEPIETDLKSDTVKAPIEYNPLESVEKKMKLVWDKFKKLLENSTIILPAHNNENLLKAEHVYNELSHEDLSS